MIGHGQWTGVDKNVKTWVSGPSRNTVVLSLAYAVFHALHAGGSTFLGNYQNKKVLRQSLKKNRKTKLTFFRDRS
jgi:hypothetical protein